MQVLCLREAFIERKLGIKSFLNEDWTMHNYSLILFLLYGVIATVLIQWTTNLNVTLIIIGFTLLFVLRSYPTRLFILWFLSVLIIIGISQCDYLIINSFLIIWLGLLTCKPLILKACTFYKVLQFKISSIFFKRSATTEQQPIGEPTRHPLPEELTKEPPPEQQKNSNS